MPPYEISDGRLVRTARLEGTNAADGLGLLSQILPAQIRTAPGNRGRGVDATHAYQQLGRLRAYLNDLEEHNSTFCADEGADIVKVAFCKARLVETLASMNLDYSKEVELSDLQALLRCIEDHFADGLKVSRDQVDSGNMEFEALAELYLPGTKLVGPIGGSGEEMGFLLRSCFYEEHKTMFGKKLSFHLELEYFASVGDRFAVVRFQEQIGWWRGIRPKSALFFLPADTDKLLRLEERGQRYGQFATGNHFLTCRKGCFFTGRPNDRDQHRAIRVMVDLAAATDAIQKPASGGDEASVAIESYMSYYRKAVRQGRLEKKDSAVQRDEASGILVLDNFIFFDAIPPERWWNAWPTVVAFSFASKVWGSAAVDGLSAMVWEEAAWDALVIPPERKALLRAVVQRQREIGSIDVIQGKGEGTTFLLYGPPGTGKTLTAEAMAEVLHRPLYVLSAGEMGTTPQELEKKLADALRLCSRWDCICLVDEADVFLEQRTSSDILHNALVCVMLRELEYHPGVLFLTTNKAHGIDPAVQSRLSLALKYEPLDAAGRQQVWSNLLKRVAPGRAFDLKALASDPINGRQIKNCVRLSMALALDCKTDLSQSMLMTTLETVSTFQRDLRGENPTEGRY